MSVNLENWKVKIIPNYSKTRIFISVFKSTLLDKYLPVIANKAGSENVWISFEMIRFGILRHNFLLLILGCTSSLFIKQNGSVACGIKLEIKSNSTTAKSYCGKFNASLPEITTEDDFNYYYTLLEVFSLNY